MLKYPFVLGPFVLVAPFGESGGVAVCPALRRRTDRRGRGAGQPERCLVTHLRLGGKHAPALERRFRRASELGRRLTHPGMARTLAVGRIEDRLFVAHELVAGVDLGRLPPRAMDPATAAHVASELTRPLEYLHGFERRGLLHHGVVPVNVHLGWDGRVRLLDCGLAIPDTPEERGEAADEAGARGFRGARHYNAPEIRAGEAGDARSDVYSLGVLLWELLAGRTWLDGGALARGESPHAAPLDEGTTERRLAGAPEGGRGIARAPAGLYAVIARAMSPEPARRFPDMAALRAALAPFAPGRLAGRRAIKRMLGGRYDEIGSRAKLNAALRAALPLLPGEAAGAPVGRRFRALPPVAALAAVAAIAILAERFHGSAPAPVALDRTAAVATVRQAARPPAEVQRVPPPPAAETPPPPPPPPPARPVRRRARAVEAEARAVETLRAAEARFQWGDLEGAERFARTALRDLAASPRAFYFLGVVLLAKGDAVQAKDAFERTLALDPEYVDAEAKLRLASSRAAARPH